MVTRGIGATTREIGAFRSTVQGTILPVLGLSAALSLLGGGLNDATAAGRQASSATYGLQTSLYGLQDAIARALLPIIEEITPHLADAVDWFVDLNEATDGWAVKVGLATAAILPFRRQILGLLRLLGRIPGVAGAAGGALGAVGTGAAVAASAVAAGTAGAAGLGVIAHDAITGNYGASRAVDETLNTRAAGTAVQSALPYEARPIEGGLLENASRFYRGLGQSAGQAVGGAVGSAGSFVRETVTPNPPPQAVSNIVNNITVEAAGVFDTEGLTRQLRNLFEQGLIGGF